MRVFPPTVCISIVYSIGHYASKLEISDASTQQVDKTFEGRRRFEWLVKFRAMAVTPQEPSQPRQSGGYFTHIQIAYFSMEIAVAPNIPTYSGGLGVLAGDTLRSAADTGLPLLAVTLLHRCLLYTSDAA